MAPLVIPDPSLMLLVGAAGSGKSTLAARLFAPDEIVSSDALRAVVSGDEADQRATAVAFRILHRTLARRLPTGLLTVVDATNALAAHRRPLIRLAQAAGPAHRRDHARPARGRRACPEHSACPRGRPGRRRSPPCVDPRPGRRPWPRRRRHRSGPHPARSRRGRSPDGRPTSGRADPPLGPRATPRRSSRSRPRPARSRACAPG